MMISLGRKLYAQVAQKASLAHTSRPSSNTIPVHQLAKTAQPMRQIRSFTATPFKQRREYYLNGRRISTFSRFVSSVSRMVHTTRPRHVVMVGIGATGFYLLYLLSTEKVEMTGRRRLNVISKALELEIGAESCREILYTERGKILSRNNQLTKMVDSVMRRLLPGTNMDKKGWQVYVIKDADSANAFVLPGGKVFVYTGILSFCKDEDGLAAVLGHEIAHVVAHHPAESMSNKLIKLSAGIASSLLFDIAGHVSSLLMTMLYTLPNSRTQEAEADYIGLMLMAKACYKPEAAGGVWTRMHEEEENEPLEFMSSHPSRYNRMERIQGWLEKANEIYEENDCKAVRENMPGFRKALFRTS